MDPSEKWRPGWLFDSVDKVWEVVSANFITHQRTDSDVHDRRHRVTLVASAPVAEQAGSDTEVLGSFKLAPAEDLDGFAEFVG